jgi:nitrite reductase (NADH) small subunit
MSRKRRRSIRASSRRSPFDEFSLRAYRKGKNKMSNQWKVICRVNDIPVLGARVVQRNNQPNVAIFRNSEDKVFALLDKCPHKGGPLSQGIVFGERVACPLHNWNIELGSGCAVAPDEGCAQKFSVMVENGEVYLDAAELNCATSEAAAA